MTIDGVDAAKIGDKTLRKALEEAQRIDGAISHLEAVTLIRKTLDKGQISTKERRGLARILKNAHFRGFSGNRAMNLLLFFLKETDRGVAKNRALKVDQYAGYLACSFLKRNGSSAFVNLSRDEVGAGILTRIACPGLINQSGTPLCGPSAVMFNLARERPAVYARYIIDLFEKGKGNLGKIVVKPGSDLKKFSPPRGKIAHVDWIATASLRDSENTVFDYDVYSSGVSGMTNPDTMENWLKRIGHLQVRNEANIFLIKDRANLQLANDLHQKGWQVSMLINADMLSYSKKKQTSKSLVPTHWVVLTSPVQIAKNSVRMTVFSWGQGKMQVPQLGTLSLDDFLDNYYGFVAARY